LDEGELEVEDLVAEEVFQPGVIEDRPDERDVPLIICPEDLHAENGRGRIGTQGDEPDPAIGAFGDTFYIFGPAGRAEHSISYEGGEHDGRHFGAWLGFIDWYQFPRSGATLKGKGPGFARETGPFHSRSTRVMEQF
jgi:hypothetical protein